MSNLSKFNDFNNISFMKEHDKLIKKFNIEFIFLKSIKIPVICLYRIVDILFKNNSKKLEISDIILLTLTATAILSKEKEDDIMFLIKELTNRNIKGFLPIVKRSLNSIKIISNIILKNDGLVIKNIEEFLKYKFSIRILNLIFSYLFIFNIKIKDFSGWYKSDQLNGESKDLLKYITINYNL